MHRAFNLTSHQVSWGNQVLCTSTLHPTTTFQEALPCIHKVWSDLKFYFVPHPDPSLLHQPMTLK